MEANQPANPQSGEGHNQSEETGTTEHVISIRDRLEERFRKLMDFDPLCNENHEERFMESQKVDELAMERYPVPHEPRQPYVVTIGPFDYGWAASGGKRYKLQLTKLFIAESHQPKEKLYDNILEEIESFKKCYDQQVLLEFHGNDEDLAWMFFVNGCAVIQSVRYWFDGEIYDIADDQMDLILTRDLLLLKNQLPLGVLNLVMGFSKEGGELYQNERSVGKQSKQFRQSICRFIKIIATKNFQRWEKGVKADSVSFNKANHLLGLIWMNLVKKEKDYCLDNTKPTPRQFHSVKDLQAAGIILEPNNSSSSLRDISFIQGIFLCKLKIPSFRVSKQWEFLVYNLIAFEMQPNFENDRVVTSYISFLNSLIATKEDVAELRKAGILFNSLQSDDEVLRTFQHLTSNLERYPDIFSNIKEKLIYYFTDEKSMTKRKWSSEAMQVYFRSPWTTIGVVSATFLLILTIIQTVFSVLAYAQRR